MHKPKHSAEDDLFETYFADLSLDEEKTPHTDCDTLTLWIPKAKKSKYAAIQKRTHQEFSKRLKKLVIAVIDRFPDDDAA